MSVRTCAVVTALATIAVAVAAAPKPAHIHAAWRSVDVTIDGSDADWPMPAIPPFEGRPVSMSVQNDGEALFLRLRTSDRPTMQLVLRGGLIVWFDPGGRDRRVFGIKYPVGAPLTEDDLRRKPGGTDPRDGGGSRGRPTEGVAAPRAPLPGGEAGREGARRGEPPIALPDPADLARLVPARLELLGENKDRERTLVLDHAQGIGVAVALREGSLVYELRVPLAEDRSVVGAVGVAPGATIGLGIETLKIDIPDPGRGQPRSGGMGRPGGPGGGGAGRPGAGMGGRGGPGGVRPETPKPWREWVRVQLASGAQ